jgi:hypothetical protein
MGGLMQFLKELSFYLSRYQGLALEKLLVMCGARRKNPRRGFWHLCAYFQRIREKRSRTRKDGGYTSSMHK